MEQKLDFDDVLLLPVPSSVDSRSDVDISVKLTSDFTLRFPVIASPMRGIVDAQFCSKFADLGGIGILHRFYDTEEEWYREAKSISENSLRFGLSVGLNDWHWKKMMEYGPDILLIDVANGYTNSLLKFVTEVKRSIREDMMPTLLMAGNVATYDGANALYNAGCDIVRCGIGSGGLCSTRNVTGVGVPQLSAISDCSQSDCILLADGGIRNSGDAVKAFVFGSDVIMLGSLLAQTYESPSEGIVYGMASRHLQEMKYTQIKSVEGFEKVVEKKMSLAQFVEEFSWGIKSAGTYLNARNLKEFQYAEYVKVGSGSIKKLE